MIGVERFEPGTAARAVAEHLHQVHAEATAQLAGVELHQRLMCRLVICWLGRVSDERRDLDRFEPARALRHVAWPRPPASQLAAVHGDITQLMADLHRFEWLEPVRTGTTTLWRARIGVRFAAAELRSAHRPRTTPR